MLEERDRDSQRRTVRSMAAKMADAERAAFVEAHGNGRKYGNRRLTERIRRRAGMRRQVRRR
jgi:hypothetical protein